MRSCFHCGDQCVEELEFNDHVFCCTGCKTVYEILSGNEMDNYYSLDNKAGIRPSATTKGQFNYLDLAEFESKLVFFEEGSIKKVKFFLPQIHCSSCLWLLERLNQLKKGILQSQVDFVKKEVVITFDTAEISLRELAELCSTIGYSPKITLEDDGKKRTDNTNRRLIIQIGIAGFCFGNIMLLSFPEYLGIGAQDANFQFLFSSLNLILSIPVLIFGARDYLVSAYKAVKTRAINIDVPISLGILALYLRSLYEIVFQIGAGYMDSFAGLIFFLLIGKWFQHQTYTAINFERDYESYFPISVTKFNEGKEEIIALKRVKVGDRLLIRNNELIPTDAILMKGKGQIDYSFVTGESALVNKNEGDKLFAGGKQEGTIIEIEVLKDVENSYLTQLWNNPIFDKEKETISLSDTISRYFTFFIIGVALISGFSWYFIDASQSVFVITSVLIVACPCAIALSVPFTYGNAIRILGRNGFYLRSTRIIEPLTQVTAFVFDKTGTITLNNEGKLRWEGKTLSIADEGHILACVEISAHPLSRAIAKQLHKKESFIADSITEEPGNGISAIINGEAWKVGSASFIGESVIDNQTRVFVSRDGQILGSYVFSNTYREGLENLFNSIASSKSIHILSGDNDAELAVLQKIAPAGTKFNFNQKPVDKLAYIAQLQDQGANVMMLGDGLNDAGALKQSNVGISVVDDIYSFSPASDAIISGAKLMELPNLIRYAATSNNIVKLSYIFSLLYNTIGLIFAVSGALTPLIAAVLMPLSSISVVLFVTLMTNIKGRGLNKK